MNVSNTWIFFKKRDLFIIVPVYIWLYVCVSICEGIHVLQSSLCGNVFLVHCCTCQYHWPTIFQGFSCPYFLSYHSSDENKYIDHSIHLFQSFRESELKLVVTLEVFEDDLRPVLLLTALKMSLAKASANNGAVVNADTQ